jgi:soluble lytic murein transglycosylase-like protein
MKLLPATVLGLILACANTAQAELVFFSTGRTLSVKSHHADGELLVLTLRSGGEMSIEPSAIARITPDEVPYPEDNPTPVAPPPPVVAVVAVPYGEIIDKVATREGVSPQLVRAVIKVESAYQATARSPKGAMGLMQLMPGTARQYDVAKPYEAESNIEGGIKYLKSLLSRFELPLALAAYNAGEAAVKRFNGIPPYPETRKYVADILKLVAN